jgi:hypothetical protein
LDDEEGAYAVALLGHVLAARDAAGEHGLLPFAPDWLRRAALRVGLPDGRNLCRRAVARLRASGVLVPAGTYRQAYGMLPKGFHVPLYRVDVPVWLGSRGLRTAPTLTPTRLRFATPKASVATRGRVKWWWEHALFGNPDGVRPHGVGEKELTTWRSRKHRRCEESRATAFYGERESL